MLVLLPFFFSVLPSHPWDLYESRLSRALNTGTKGLRWAVPLVGCGCWTLAQRPCVGKKGGGKKGSKAHQAGSFNTKPQYNRSFVPGLFEVWVLSRFSADPTRSRMNAERARLFGEKNG
jgi:hypothetical protein